MKSIMQTERRCYICGAINGLHEHHIFFGTGNRKVSERNGFKCWLCGRHHNLSEEGVHFNRQLDLRLKMACQAKYEEHHSRREFMALIGKNYL